MNELMNKAQLLARVDHLDSLIDNLRENIEQEAFNFAGIVADNLSAEFLKIASACDVLAFPEENAQEASK